MLATAEKVKFLTEKLKISEEDAWELMRRADSWDDLLMELQVTGTSLERRLKEEEGILLTGQSPFQWKEGDIIQRKCQDGSWTTLGMALDGLSVELCNDFPGGYRIMRPVEVYIVHT